MLNQVKGLMLNKFSKSEKLLVRITNQFIINLYMFILFRFKILLTSIYLLRNGWRRNDLQLKLVSKNNLEFPALGLPVINPSIFFDGHKLKGAARITNAGIEPICDYRGMPIQPYRDTAENLKNGIITFTTSLEGVISEIEFIHNISEIPNFEDPRIFNYLNETFLIMTQVLSPIGKAKAPWKSSIVLENLENRKISNFSSPAKKGIEKNWVPIESKTDIKILYSSNPLTIITFDPSTGLVGTESSEISSPVSLNNRTQIISTPHPCIPFIRIASKKYAHSKVGYTPFHYFEIFSKNLEPVKLSRPFIFSSIQMEMCQGLTLKDDLLVLSWTELDKFSKIGSIHLETVLKLF